MIILLEALKVLGSFGIWFLAAVVVVTVHEYAHAFTSWRLGDKLPKFNRRLTLNPVSHTDIVGILFFMATSFGWGRPVEISPKHYKDKKKGVVLVGLSGPIASVMLAVAAAVLVKVLSISGNLNLPIYILDYLSQFFSKIYLYSFNLAIISLIPMFPFDGFMVWGKIISPKGQFKLFQYQNLMLTIFLVIILISKDFIDIFIAPVRNIVGGSISGIIELISMAVK